jgi:Tol biopolymer transport system component
VPIVLGALALLALLGCGGFSNPAAPTPTLIPPWPEVGVPPDVRPIWTPDGNAIIYTHFPVSPEELQLGGIQVWRYDLATHARSFIAAGDLAGLCTTADTILLLRDTFLFKYICSSHSLIPVFAAAPCAGSSRNPESALLAITTTYGTRDSTWGIWLTSPTGDAIKGLSNHAANPAWSPSGIWLLHTRYAPGPISQLFLMDVEGHEFALTPADSWNDFGAWSPTGLEIAWAKRPSYGVHTIDLWIMTMDGSKERLLLSDACYPSWSPQGDRLVVIRGESGQPSDLWVVSRDGTTAAPLE